MRLKNDFSFSFGIGQGWQTMWRMAESTFGAGLKWEGGMVAISSGFPNSCAWMARTLRESVAQIFCATSFWTSKVIDFGR